MTLLPGMTPTEDLFCEVLAGRFRTGEKMWTFSNRHMHTAKSLEAKGLIFWKHAVIEGHILAGLTDAGKARLISDSYTPPMDKGGARARHVRNAEGFLQKAVLANSQQEFENYTRTAEVYATLALAEDGEK